MCRRAVAAIVCIALCAIALFSGCSGSSVISEVDSAQAFSLSSERLSDTREATFSVGDSASAALSASVAQKHGSLSILISDTTGDVIYSGSDIASATSFTLLLEGPADYTISLSFNGFTGSVDFTWETVGASVSELQGDSAADQRSAADSGTSAAAPVISNEVVITNTPAESDLSSDPATIVPDWNGKFENSDIGIVIELYWADNNTVEFQLSGNGSIVTATAKIDGTDPTRAEYTYGDEMTLTLELTGSSLILTQTGTCSLVPDSIAGEYPPVRDE